MIGRARSRHCCTDRRPVRKRIIPTPAAASNSPATRMDQDDRLLTGSCTDRMAPDRKSLQPASDQAGAAEESFSFGLVFPLVMGVVSVVPISGASKRSGL